MIFSFLFLIFDYNFSTKDIEIRCNIIANLKAVSGKKIGLTVLLKSSGKTVVEAGCNNMKAALRYLRM